ncbi:ferredoxin [Candidatus Poribacteria bacterium]|nr:ferredoxin [Candidatus Poribacteria bacterium]
MKFKVTIDREECISCGQCWETCSEFFEENSDDGFSQVISEYRIKDNPAEGEASEDLEDCVQEAADVCPVEIIDVEEMSD